MPSLCIPPVVRREPVQEGALLAREAPLPVGLELGHDVVELGAVDRVQVLLPGAPPALEIPATHGRRGRAALKARRRRAPRGPAQVEPAAGDAAREIQPQEVPGAEVLLETRAEEEEAEEAGIGCGEEEDPDIPR